MMHRLNLPCLLCLLFAGLGGACSAQTSLGLNHGAYFDTYLRSQWNNRGRDVDPLGGDEAQRLMQTYRSTFETKEKGQSKSNAGGGGGFQAQPTKTQDGGSLMRVR